MLRQELSDMGTPGLSDTAENKFTSLPVISAMQKAKLLKETREERRLLNYERYLELWDKHEGHVIDHFKKKNLGWNGPPDPYCRKERSTMLKL